MVLTKLEHVTAYDHCSRMMTNLVGFFSLVCIVWNMRITWHVKVAYVHVITSLNMDFGRVFDTTHRLLHWVIRGGLICRRFVQNGGHNMNTTPMSSNIVQHSEHHHWHWPVDGLALMEPCQHHYHKVVQISVHIPYLLHYCSYEYVSWWWWGDEVG